MAAKPKRAVKLPRTSLLERLDKPSGPDLRPQLSGMETRLGLFETDLGKVEKSLDGYVSRLKIAEAQQDVHNKDIAWLKAGQDRHSFLIKQVTANLVLFAKPSLWPLWTMLIVELAGLAYLAAKLYGYV